MTDKQPNSSHGLWNITWDVLEYILFREATPQAKIPSSLKCGSDTILSLYRLFIVHRPQWQLWPALLKSRILYIGSKRALLDLLDALYVGLLLLSFMASVACSHLEASA